mgnify:CR=1 FL=1
MGERTRGTRKANQLDTPRTSWLAKGTLIQRLRELVWVDGCVTTPATWASPPGRRCRSVHRSVEMAPRCRFGAFVYTVAPRVAIRVATRAASGGTSASAATACRRHLLAGPSRLVGKTDSARVAPLLGWHLRRGVNPHEPPMSPDSWRGRPSSHCHSALSVPRSHVHHRVAV